MKKTPFNFIILLFLCTGLKSQTDLLGKWELCKIVKLPADTQLIKPDNEQYITYNFSYNNTFAAWHQKEKEEGSGKWGFDRKENAIKVRNHTLVKSRTLLPDYNIKLTQVNKLYFVQVIEDKKGKPLEYRIFCKLPQ